MVVKKQCVAMLLAGGQGSRLGALTKKRAKPAVPYGGKYKIIDFPPVSYTHLDVYKRQASTSRKTGESRCGWTPPAMTPTPGC